MKTLFDPEPLPTGTLQPQRGTYYVPPDLEAAYSAWKCNCGPAALAALLAVPCETVRPHFPGHAKRGYANPTHLREALTALGIEHRADTGKPPRRPSFGLCFVQFGGPWMEGLPWEQYRRTHWIAVDGDRVFDVNEGGWLSRKDWESGTAPWLAEHIAGCDGTWFVRMTLHVGAGQ